MPALEGEQDRRKASLGVMEQVAVRGEMRVGVGGGAVRGSWEVSGEVRRGTGVRGGGEGEEESMGNFLCSPLNTPW